MPLYLDRHDFGGTDWASISREDLLEAHRCDLGVQEKYGVSYLTYWWHLGAKTAFCLVEAPSPDAAVEVHRVGHGNVPNKIIEVDWQTLEGFLGRVKLPPPEALHEDVAFRTIVYTRIEDPSNEAPVDSAKRALLDALNGRGGNQVGDDSEHLVGCFPSVYGALECALATQQQFVPIAALFQHWPLSICIGVSAGEPVMTHVGIFGDVVDGARDLCAQALPGEILVSKTVRDFCAGKGFAFKEFGRNGQGSRDSGPVYALVGRDELTAMTRQSAPLAFSPDSLTSREVEVLQLVALGKTNQEIAGQLVISLNTVATHVRNILDKTDSSNRAEAACYAIRQNLL
jgi:DNA-binding CsgD family transcriptional regulator